MKLLFDILMHIMLIIVVCYWLHVGSGETCNKFSCSKSPRITKKIIPLRTITPRSNPLSKHSQISQILDQTPSCYLSTRYRRPISTINMIVNSLKTNDMDFRYLQGMHFPQKYYHNRLQGRPHEKEFELFSNKNKCHKSWNWKGRWSLVSVLL